MQSGYVVLTTLSVAGDHTSQTWATETEIV